MKFCEETIGEKKRRKKKEEKNKFLAIGCSTPGISMSKCF